MGTSFNFDESSYLNMIDDKLSNLDLDVLIKANYELLKEKKDTSIIDKAIAEHRRKTTIVEQQKKKEELIEKHRKKQMRRAVLFGLIDGLISVGNTNTTDSNVQPWKEDAIKNEGYELHNFEEEELEEDDYYFDDDK